LKVLIFMKFHNFLAVPNENCKSSSRGTVLKLPILKVPIFMKFHNFLAAPNEKCKSSSKGTVLKVPI